MDRAALFGHRDGTAARLGRTAGTARDLFRGFEAIHTVFCGGKREESSHKVIVACYDWCCFASPVEIPKYQLQKSRFHARNLLGRIFIDSPKAKKAAFHEFVFLHGENKHANGVCDTALCNSQPFILHNRPMVSPLPAVPHNFCCYPVFLRIFFRVCVCVCVRVCVFARTLACICPHSGL